MAPLTNRIISDAVPPIYEDQILQAKKMLHKKIKITFAEISKISFLVPHGKS